MYGANYNTNSGDSIYRWSPTTGEMMVDGVAQGAPGGNKIFMTIWDGGGNDTYDFSNYTSAVSVSLNPGEWSTASSAQLAYLGGGYYATGNIANALLYQGNIASLIENAVGGSSNDVLIGNLADNWLTGNAGNDYLDGGLGIDTSGYSGASIYYSWLENADGSWTISDLRTTGSDGSDILLNIEFLSFSDTLVAIDGYAPPPPLENHAPVITSAGSTLSVTEWADKSVNETNNAAHTGGGTISFTDADPGQSFTAAFAANTTGYLGTFSLDTSAVDSGYLNWSFAVSDGAIDHLKAGQTLTQTYDVTIQDSLGALATQTVTVTINGSDDASVKTTGKGGANPNKKGGLGNAENASVDLMSDDSFHFNIEDDQMQAPLEASTANLWPWMWSSDQNKSWDLAALPAAEWINASGHGQAVIELLGFNSSQHDVLLS
jgi:VCBS repeat-containing protein